MEPTVTAALAGMVGAGLPILTKFFIEFWNAKKKAQTDERAEVWNEATKLRQDLQGQILDLRTNMVKLQEANLTKAIENAELKGKIQALDQKITYLEQELSARDTEIMQLRSERDALERVRDELQAATVQQLAALTEEVRRLRDEDDVPVEGLAGPLNDLQKVLIPEANPVPKP